MKIEDKLEIVIPTFNRCEKLGITFSYLLDENSPVKNCDITILDNCSTDDTPNLVKKIAEKHPNVKYQRNARNIGSFGSIVRGFEIASKEYLWELGDNDTYDWKYFDDVLKAIKNEADVVIVGYGICKKKPKDPRICVLQPGGADVWPLLIWRRDNISDAIFRMLSFYQLYHPVILLSVLLINAKPNLNVVLADGNIVKWTPILFKERKKDYERYFMMDNRVNAYSPMVSLCMCREKGLRDEALRGYLDSSYLPSFLRGLFLKDDFKVCWVVLAVLPWKFKFYLLAVGLLMSFKRVVQKV